MDEKRLSMYLGDTLKTIFDGLNQAVNHSGTNFTLVSYDDRDFIQDSVGDNGELDANLLCRNIGKIVDCDTFMKDKLIAEFERARVTYAAVGVLEPKQNGDLTERCYFVTDRHDKNRVEAIVRQLNKYEKDLQENPKEFLASCWEQGTPVCGIRGIDSFIYDAMRKDKSLHVPHYVLPNAHGTYELRIRQTDEPAVREALIKTMILYTGRTGEMLVENRNIRQAALSDALAKAMDDKQSFILFDGNSPDHYIRTDMKGFYNIIRTGAGEQQLNFVERIDPSFQDKVYHVIEGYSNIVVRSARNLDINTTIEELAKANKKAVDMNTKVEFYKRSLSEAMVQSLQRDYLGRMHDNRIRFGDAIAHATLQKEDFLKGDLESDRSLNDRAIAGIVKEVSIDLSDLYGDAFIEKFTEQVLGTQMEESAVEKAKIETAVLKTSELIALSQEPAEVKLAVINEISQTLDDVRNMEYEFSNMAIEELVQELESRDHEIGHNLEDERDI